MDDFQEQGGKKEEVSSSFELQVKDFFSKNKVSIYILTPCFASLCYVNYVNSLLSTTNLFKLLNIEYHIEFCRNDSLVSRARNNLVARAMADPNMTHIMFIDNDITWDPSDILKLIMSEKQLVGGIYPLKNYDWKKLIGDENDAENKNVIEKWISSKRNSQINNICSDELFIQNKLLKYNVNYLENTLSIQNNLAKVRHLPTGFMMIKRNVIDKMSKSYPSTKYVDDVSFLKPNENEFAYALFDCGVEEGHYFSEDWLFCHRWVKMGGTIWIDVSINLVHTGIEDYRGSYFASLVS